MPYLGIKYLVFGNMSHAGMFQIAPCVGLGLSPSRGCELTMCVLHSTAHSCKSALHECTMHLMLSPLSLARYCDSSALRAFQAIAYLQTTVISLTLRHSPAAVQAATALSHIMSSFACMQCSVLLHHVGGFTMQPLHEYCTMQLETTVNRGHPHRLYACDTCSSTRLASSKRCGA